MNQRPQYLSAEDRRAATVQAVVDLAAEQNPAEITTTAIADRMGLTQGALFRHFPSKEAILEATMSWVGERLLIIVDKAAEGAASPAVALEAMFMTHIDFVAKHPGVPRMLFGELQRSGETLVKRMVQTLIRQYEQRLRRLMEAGRRRASWTRNWTWMPPPCCSSARSRDWSCSLCWQATSVGSAVMRQPCLPSIAVASKAAHETPVCSAGATTIRKPFEKPGAMSMTAHSGRGIWMRVISLIAIGFGLLTIREGGAVLFYDGAARAAAGSYVPFVLWFNFLAGFVYIVAGIGLWIRRRWAAWVAIVITVATALVFLAFGVHVYLGLR